MEEERLLMLKEQKEMRGRCAELEGEKEALREKLRKVETRIEELIEENKENKQQ